jgi:putative transposase
MPDYRRVWHPGGTYFFTVNLLQRQGNDLLIRHIDLLREVVTKVRQRHPFVIHGWVVLPEHLIASSNFRRMTPTMRPDGD